jgi:hypothetical protein
MAIPFPSTGYISTFDGPDENPLSENGAWRGLDAHAPMQKLGPHNITNTTATINYSTYVAQAFYASGTNIIEIWACTVGGQLGAALETWRVYLFQNIQGAYYGYMFRYGGAIGKSFELRVYTGGGTSGTNIAQVGGGYPDRLGLRINGAVIEGWAMYGGVWQLMCSATNTAYRGYFYGGCGTEEEFVIGSLGINCFGGGVVHFTQFYRWMPGISQPPL